MPPLGSVHKASITYGDHTQETSKFEVYVGAITALSIAGFLSAFGNLQTAANALTLGSVRKQQWVGDDSTISNEWPTTPLAQRENKLEVEYMDTVTEEIFRVTLPTVDLTKLVFVPGGGDAVLFAGDDASDEVKAFVTAFEAIGRTPRSDANAIEVVGMRFVGANT